MNPQTLWAGILLFNLAFAGCLTELTPQEYAPLTDRPSPEPPTEDGEEPTQEPIEPPTEQPTPQNETNQTDRSQNQTQEPPVETIQCYMQPDYNGTHLAYVNRPMAERIYSQEGVLIEFDVHSPYAALGLATTRSTTDDLCTLEDTVLTWPAWSKREGNERYEIKDENARATAYQAIGGWQTHNQPMEEWPSPSGPSHRTFHFFVYLTTADGTTHYTSLEEATSGKGYIGVYLKNKSGRFYLEPHELANEKEFD